MQVTGQIEDVSKFMHFHFWQEVFVETGNKEKKEELAHWCYPANNCGDELTWMVLLKDTNQLVPRSNVRPAKDPLYPNLRVRPKTNDLRPPPAREPSPAPATSPPVETVSEAEDESPTEGTPSNESIPMTGTSGEPKTSGSTPVHRRPPIYNVQDNFDVPVHLPRFSPEELIGLTFLHDLEDGQRVRAKIVKKILDRDAENHERIKMLLSYDDGKVEEIVSYNELCDIVAEQHDKEASGEQEVFTFREILDHKKVQRGDPDYQGSTYNVKVLWEDCSETWIPLEAMYNSDPVTLAAYAKENGLLDTMGWK